MPSSKPGFARRQHVPLSLHGGEVHRAAGEPRAAQAGQRVVADQQTADAGRIAEHLVERDRDEVRPHHAQIEAVGRHERRRVEQHVPAARVRRLDEAQRMLDARRNSTAPETRTGWRARDRPAPEARSVAGDVDAQLRHGQRRVVDRRALRARELADAVDRVVVVDGQQQASARLERVRLADQLQRARRVEREDRRVLAGAVEILEHRARVRARRRRSSPSSSGWPSAGCRTPAGRAAPRGRAPASRRAARRRCSPGRSCPCASRRRYSAARRSSSARVPVYAGCVSRNRAAAVVTPRF